MRLLRGAVGAMTAATAIATLWLASSTPVNFGLLTIAFGVTIVGIFVVAFTGPTYGDDDA